MAGYRPIGLAPSGGTGGSTLRAGGAGGYADRRRAAAQRLTSAEELSACVTAAAARVAADVDPDGSLRAAVLAMAHVARRVSGVPVTASIGDGRPWAARLTWCDGQWEVEFVEVGGAAPVEVGAAAPPVPRAALPRAGAPRAVLARSGAAATGAGGPVAVELADLLWSSVGSPS